jgi:diaminopimelate epimerase
VAELDVELVSAERKVWSGTASLVVARTATGDIGIMPGHQPLLGVLQTGPVTIRTTGESGDGTVVAATVDMGPPSLDPTVIPFDTPGSEAVGVTVEAAGRQVELTAVSMGNPHAVVFVDDVERCPVAELGPAIGRHGRFPEGANVEFVELTGAGRAAVRVWERGVGETAACGTGACAVLVAGQQLGRLEDQVTLAFPGGEVVVRHVPSEDGGVTLTGGAVEVASGELDPAWLATHGVASVQDEEATRR